ncbi:hypothetical protein TRVA0_018S02454 [Trichomonascus vanleenenianus]|uniref:uncharacterized protein n=1 Tax=Trichomonascus vanleenenianus TaxID=2268995 RepID=UPI003EC98DFD
MSELGLYKELIEIPKLRINDYKVFESWIFYVETMLRDLGLGAYITGEGEHKNLDAVIRQNIMKALPDAAMAGCFRTKDTAALLNALKNLKVNYMW